MLPLKIALRYFFSRKKGGKFNLISVISGISLLGYIAGAAAMVIVLSVFNGFENLFTTMYNNFDPDIQIVASSGKTFESKQTMFSQLNQMEGIVGYSTVLEENVLLKYGDKQCLATAKGVDNAYLKITSIDSCLIRGFAATEENGNWFAIAGQGIAYQLSLDPTDLFNRIIFYVPDRNATNAIDMAASFRQDAIYPAGVFNVQQEVDDKYIIVPLPFLRRLLNKENELSSIEIKLNKNVDTDRFKEKLREIFPSDTYQIKNRFEQRDGFFKVMKSEKMMSYFILFFILLIAASNTIGSLFIMVIGKKKDIRMLGNMGMTKNQIAIIFITQGILQALTGGLIGIGLGLTLCYLQEHYTLLSLNEAARSLFKAYPVDVRSGDILLVFFTFIILGIITSWYPAMKARKGV